MGVVLLELGLWQNLEGFESEPYQASAAGREKTLTDKSEKYAQLCGEVPEGGHHAHLSSRGATGIGRRMVGKR